jgi:hypothetical protein
VDNHICIYCGKEYGHGLPAWKVNKTCSLECRSAHRLNTVKAAMIARWGDKPVSVTNTCEVCGCFFVGANRYRHYRACSNPDCRREVRSRAAKAANLGGNNGRPPRKTKERECLGWCGKKFKPVKDEHFCEQCRRVRRENNYADAWGAPL